MKTIFSPLGPAALALFLLTPPLRAQIEPGVEPVAPVVEKELEEAGEGEEFFILNRVPLLRKINGTMSRFEELSPLSFGAEAVFLSDWLDEGFNSAKHGLQIQQTYFTELTHEFGDVSAGVGFEYFQIDTTGAVEGPSTLERDFCVYMPFEWKVFAVSPYWCYIKYDGWDDSGEIGTEFSLDLPLNPSFVWNYDYDDGKGHYLQWGISHPIDIAPNGEKLCTFTPSMAMGANLMKYTDANTLTHIDWGLDLSIPLTEHFAVTGLLHFTKSLSHLKDEDGERVFEDIIPWAGLSLAMEF